MKRVARENAVGWLRRKVKTGRPDSARSCESVSKGERKEEKLTMTNIRPVNFPYKNLKLNLKLSSPENVLDFDQIICRGGTHIIIGPVAGSHLKSRSISRHILQPSPP